MGESSQDVDRGPACVLRGNVFLFTQPNLDVGVMPPHGFRRDSSVYPILSRGGYLAFRRRAGDSRLTFSFMAADRSSITRRASVRFSSPIHCFPSAVGSRPKLQGMRWKGRKYSNIYLCVYEFTECNFFFLFYGV